MLLLGALVIIGANAAYGQISPGFLSKPHAFLNGPTKCASCHVIGAADEKLKCLECHKEIASRLTQHRGFHARVVTGTASSTACAKCHSEHNGESFAIVRWEPSRQKFDHTKAGFVLDGKHNGLACERCHFPQRIAPAERPLIQIKDLNRTFLGVSSACTACHEDKHRGQLGATCQRCHNAETWKTGPQFDHSKTKFVLTGAHVTVKCQECHKPAGPEATVRFVGLQFQKCASCHADVHHGAFANSTCESCHNTFSWKKTEVAAKFDHSRTKYALTGKHESVRCAQCHRANDFAKRLKFDTCVSCHNPDPHKGQFAARADQGECAACHSTASFKQAKFGVKEHRATAYPLVDAHAVVACAKCHEPKGAATLYKVRFAKCLDCHSDPHNGDFAAAPYFNKCDSCHSLKAYKPSTFTLVKHKESRFPLAGGHIAVACIDCHKPVAPVAKKMVRTFRSADLSCSSCHRDPHNGQFHQLLASIGGKGASPGCTSCHSVSSWRDLSGFDHARTRFALVGAHRAVACISCHRPPNLQTTLNNVVFRSAPSDCKSCHEEVHGGQFIRAGRTPECAQCHNATRWRPSLFDHAKTAFPLDGAHKNVKCALCHGDFRLVAGKKVLFYMPTPKQCAACHGSKGAMQ